MLIWWSVQRTVSGCFAVFRQLWQIRNSVSTATFQTLMVALVMSRLDYRNNVLNGLQTHLYAASRGCRTQQHGWYVNLNSTLRSHHRRAVQLALAAYPGANRLQGSRSGIQGSTWDCIWTCCSCCWCAWSTGSSLCYYKPSGGVIFQIFDHRQSSIPGSGSSTLE